MNLKARSPLIIGYGNELRADDAAGLHVARALAAAGYDAIEVPQLFPELAERISRASFVCFVDCHMDLAPGEVAVTPLEAHHFGLHAPGSPRMLLTLAGEVYGTRPEAVLVGIGPDSVELGEGLSAVVKGAVPRAASLIKDQLAHKFGRS